MTASLGPGIAWCALALRPGEAWDGVRLGDAVQGDGPRARALVRGVRWPEPGGGVVGVPASVAELVAAFSVAMRPEGSAVALLLERPTATLRFAAGRALDLAETQPYGIAVDAAPHEPRATPLTAALQLSAALMRQRSPATWVALEALDAAGGNAASAARALGISGQAVRAHRQRGHHAATEFLVPLFDALLAPP